MLRMSGSAAAASGGTEGVPFVIAGGGAVSRVMRASRLRDCSRQREVRGKGPEPMKATRRGGVLVAERMAQSSRRVSSS
jgi:hypothetical protein